MKLVGSEGGTSRVDSVVPRGKGIGSEDGREGIEHPSNYFASRGKRRKGNLTFCPCPGLTVPGILRVLFQSSNSAPVFERNVGDREQSHSTRREGWSVRHLKLHRHRNGQAKTHTSILEEGHALRVLRVGGDTGNPARGPHRCPHSRQSVRKVTYKLA